jgi:hypothetical protein
VQNDNRDVKPGLLDPVDRRGTRLLTLIAVGIVFVVLALLMLTRGGLPGPEREQPRTGPKIEQPPAPPTRQQ